MSADFAEQVRLKEYESLREEILQGSRVVLQVVSIAFSATGIIIVQGIAQPKAGQMYLAFLIPFPILWISFTYVAIKRWSILRIGAYIRACIEPLMDGPGWETLLDVHRRRFGGASGLRFNIVLVEWILFNAWGITCLALFFSSGGLDANVWYRLLGVALFGVLFVTSAIQSIALHREEGRRVLVDQWRELRCSTSGEHGSEARDASAEQR